MEKSALSLPVWRSRWLVRLAGVIAFCGGATVLRAELTWPAKTVELFPSDGAAVLEARFAFTNGGPAAVDIRDVQSSCGCTTVTLQQRHYDPGQSGEIVARYTVGQRVGIQSKTIAVLTSDAPDPVTLTLVVHPVEWLRAQPPYVTWKQGEPGTPKTIRLIPVLTAPPIQNLSVQSSNPGVTAELQPADGSDGYEIRVAAKATDQPSFSTLTIRFRIRGLEKTLRCFAFVQTAPAADDNQGKRGSPPSSSP